MEKRNRFLKAIDGEHVDRPPMWLMRQAGRFLPDYRAVRAQHGFWEVCKTPTLSTKVALEPLNKFPLDAAIVFSDILVVPEAMGLDVEFGKGHGPVIGKTLKTKDDLNAWQRQGIMDRLAYLPNAVKHLHETLAGSHAILGFAGAPFTLLAYIAEGGSSDDFRKVRVMLHEQPALAHDALSILADIVTDLLLAQCAAGADLVQIFDTWGGLLTREEYAQFCVPAIAQITERLHRQGKRVLLYVRGGAHLLPLYSSTGADGFSLDWRLDWAEARAALPNAILQGNIDPIRLLGNEAQVSAVTQQLLDTMKRTSGYQRCIVNLGHGIVPETPVSSVAALCETVKRAA